MSRFNCDLEDDAGAAVCRLKLPKLVWERVVAEFVDDKDCVLRLDENPRLMPEAEPLPLPANALLETTRRMEQKNIDSERMVFASTIFNN
jgi:hypothetical protein